MLIRSIRSRPIWAILGRPEKQLATLFRDPGVQHVLAVEDVLAWSISGADALTAINAGANGVGAALAFARRVRRDPGQCHINEIR